MHGPPELDVTLRAFEVVGVNCGFDGLFISSFICMFSN